MSNEKVKEEIEDTREALDELEESINNSEQEPESEIDVLTSESMNAPEAIKHIEDTQIEELGDFMHADEDRVTVKSAWEKKLEDANKIKESPESNAPSSTITVSNLQPKRSKPGYPQELKNNAGFGYNPTKNQ